MKNKNKALLLSLCAALLVVATVLTTIAWLTSTTGPVTNTFTVGKVQIDLHEAKTDKLGEYYLITSGESTTSFDADASGETRTPYDATKVNGNEYALRPGHEYNKNVYVEILDGSEPCYLFVKVENDFAGSEKAGQTIAEQMSAYGWVRVAGYDGVWALHDTTTTRKICKYDSSNPYIPVFDKLVLSGTANVEELTGKEITIKAYAVQADGFDAEDIPDESVWITVFAAMTEESEETTTPEPTT